MMLHRQMCAMLAPGDTIISNFIEQMGDIAQADGMPRIAGRIMGLLFVEDGPFSLSELADTLKVSRGSISTNARRLLETGIIERVEKAGDRQDYYRVADAPYARLLRGAIAQIERIRIAVDSTQAKLPPEQEAAKARLAALGSFYRAAGDTLTQLVDRFEHNG